jgi:uncharacterized membrane protein
MDCSSVLDFSLFIIIFLQSSGFKSFLGSVVSSINMSYIIFSFDISNFYENACVIIMHFINCMSLCCIDHYHHTSEKFFGLPLFW